MEGLLPMGPTPSSFFTKGINNRAVSRTTPATLGLFINRIGKLIWVENLGSSLYRSCYVFKPITKYQPLPRKIVFIETLLCSW